MKIVYPLFIAVVLCVPTFGMLIIDTTTSWDGCSMGTLGPGGIIGQTFDVVPDNTRLDYFSFYVADRVNPDFMTFQFHVMEWSIPELKAVGPVLYSSPFLSSTNNHGNDGWEKLTFETGGLELLYWKEYIAIVTVPDSIHGECWLGCVPDVYCGEFVYGSGSIETIHTISWTTDYPIFNGEMACEFGFNIPEPSTLLLMGLGGLLFRRRK